jgi:hypothetical protein
MKLIGFSHPLYSRIRTLRLPIAVVCLLSFCAAIVFVVSAYTRPANLSVTSQPPPAPSQSVSPVKGPVQLIRFTLYDAGIFPREAFASKGIIAISIEDLSGGTTGLVVERRNGITPDRKGLVTRANNQWRGRSDLMLQEGVYDLYMADRPDNRATLIVEP